MRKASILGLCCLLFSLSLLAENNLSELTINQTQTGLKNGDYTLNDIADYYLNRIRQFDDQGPTLNSVVQINPQLKQLIQAQQKKIDHDLALGKLFGVFILLKDNIATADGMANTAGSWLLREHYPANQAYLVKQILSQDGIILGKTNLSEWANFRSSLSSSGWSSLYGQTKNPYDPSRSACGSSSGSGVAIAADFALTAIGTETDGSVTCPSSVNGLVGIKPTLGLVSRSGIIPIAHSQDTAGPMARTVTDAVVLLEAMMGKDPQDGASLLPKSLLSHLKVDGLKGKRIGVASNMRGYHPQLDALFEKQIPLLIEAGAEVFEVELINKDAFGDDEFTVLLSEFKTDLSHYLKHNNAPMTSLKQVIEYNKTYAEQTMPFFGQDILIAAEATEGSQGNTYNNALKRAKRLSGKEGIDATLKKHQLDLLIAPTNQPAWKIDHINGDHYLGAASSPAAVSGYPHITVPMGLVSGLPVGISFFSGYLKEGILIEAAYAYEQASQARIPPVLSSSSQNRQKK